MTYKYLIISPVPTVWGKNKLDKGYFVSAVQRGDLIIDTEANTYFDKDSNSWKPLKGDVDNDL
jgi:hypothetical protein